MDWIENLLHVSPDGGTGSFELLIVTAVAFSLAVILVARSRRVRNVGGLRRQRRRWSDEASDV